jgi:hypothetical protein
MKTRHTTGMVLGFGGFAVLVAGCSAADGAEPAQATGEAGEAVTTIPAAIAVPAGNELAFSLTVSSGTQGYVCANGAWTFDGPWAVLSQDGAKMGWHAHFPDPGAPTAEDLAHPYWKADRFNGVVDGSVVVGTKLAAVTVSKSAIPWLLLQATSHPDGNGAMADVSFIQRVKTTGGLAPTGSCTGAEVKDVPYTATYNFYKPTKPVNTPPACDATNCAFGCCAEVNGVPTCINGDHQSRTQCGAGGAACQGCGALDCINSLGNYEGILYGSAPTPLDRPFCGTDQ